MPTLDDAANYWDSVGGFTWRYDQEAHLQNNGTATTTVSGTDWRGQKWSKTVTRDSSGGICLTLARRFVECRMLNFDDHRVIKFIKAAFDIAKLQQATVEKGDFYTAAGVKGERVGGNILDRVADGPDLLGRILGTPAMYMYSMYENKWWAEGHAVAFDTRGGEFWFFDANGGLFLHHTPKPKQIADFTDTYWQALGYSQGYAGGSRVLYKF